VSGPIAQTEHTIPVSGRTPIVDHPDETVEIGPVDQLVEVVVAHTSGHG